ncbi:TetR/AcrR family transcriptional regulator [Oleomonas cavernae]|uniref:TetR/AcrR family transcriptional regulator n=1 Tax=Oleomonas cavernae TaxID=2320859 RepID=A0A418WUD3_9PROT|nr:TetR/AcrR family transcriptional regulator [Oleomonas cavernae]RJF94872.1 TetR/AcrR family transcriptional regulator [Oleomonas cavernae]
MASSKVDAILVAARTLFLEAGFDGVNLDSVAARAGVSRQTVYNRFGGKEALFRAVVERHWTLLKEGAFLPGPGIDPRTDTPAVILRRIAEKVRSFVVHADQVAFTRLVVAESRRLPWIAEDFYALGKAPAVDAFVDCLRQMHAAGSIDCPKPVLAAHQFLGLIQEFMIWPMSWPSAPQRPPCRRPRR